MEFALGGEVEIWYVAPAGARRPIRLTDHEMYLPYIHDDRNRQGLPIRQLAGSPDSQGVPSLVENGETHQNPGRVPGKG